MQFITYQNSAEISKDTKKVRNIHADSDPAFNSTITDLITDFMLQDIVETGTYTGQGSTSIFAKTGLPVYTIEAKPSFAKQARQYLKDENVVVFNAFSLPKTLMLKYIVEQQYLQLPLSPTLKTDGPPSFYLKELFYDTEHVVLEDMLPSLILNERRQLIFLDSAGAIGYLEAMYVAKLLEKHNLQNKKIILLDDVDHIKHGNSVIDLAEKWGWVVSITKSGRLGWAVHKSAMSTHTGTFS
jgi:hypothetical protein